MVLADKRLVEHAKHIAEKQFDELRARFADNVPLLNQLIERVAERIKSDSHDPNSK